MTPSHLTDKLSLKRFRHLEFDCDVAPRNSEIEEDATGTKVKSIDYGALKVTSVQNFYSQSIDGSHYNGDGVSLTRALSYIHNAQSYGLVASMPWLLKISDLSTRSSSKNNFLPWSSKETWYNGFSQELVGFDTKGKYVKKGGPLIIGLHGVMPISPLDNISNPKVRDKVGGIEFNQDRFDTILESTIPLFSAREIQDEKHNAYGVFGVVLDYYEAGCTYSGTYNLTNNLLHNPLIAARMGSLEYLENFVSRYGTPFKVIHPYKDVSPKCCKAYTIKLGSNGVAFSSEEFDFVGVRFS